MSKWQLRLPERKRYVSFNFKGLSQQIPNTYQVLPLQARVDLGVMAMKWYTEFCKVLLEPHHQIV